MGETRRMMFLVHAAHRVILMAIFGICRGIIIFYFQKVKKIVWNQMACHTKPWQSVVRAKGIRVYKHTMSCAVATNWCVHNKDTRFIHAQIQTWCGRREPCFRVLRCFWTHFSRFSPNFYLNAWHFAWHFLKINIILAKCKPFIVNITAHLDFIGLFRYNIPIK